MTSVAIVFRQWQHGFDELRNLVGLFELACRRAYSAYSVLSLPASPTTEVQSDSQTGTTGNRWASTDGNVRLCRNTGVLHDTEFPGIAVQVLTTRLGHHDEVFETDAAEFLFVQSGFDRDNLARP